MALAQGLALSNVNALISRGVSEKQQGAALGINGSLLALSQGVIPPFAGLVSALGPSVPFLLGASIVLCAWWYLYSPLLILKKYGGVRSVRR